jgi:hypothetical protein
VPADPGLPPKPAKKTHTNIHWIFTINLPATGAFRSTPLRSNRRTSLMRDLAP